MDAKFHIIRAEAELALAKKALETQQRQEPEVEVALEAGAVEGVGNMRINDTPVPDDNELACIQYGSKLLACSFFYGYLHLVLPECEELKVKTFRERLNDYGDENSTDNTKIIFPIEKMFILMPESCFIPKNFNEEMKMESVKSLEVSVKERAGVIRPYTSSIYMLYPKEGSVLKMKRIYAVVEGATSLMTLYNLFEYSAGLTMFPPHHKRLIRQYFPAALEKIIKEDRRCSNLCELISYNDMVGDNKVSVADVVLERIEKLYCKKHGIEQ